MRLSDRIHFWTAVTGSAASLAAAAVTLAPGEPVLGTGTHWAAGFFLTMLPVFGVALVRAVIAQTRHGNIWRDWPFLRQEAAAFPRAFRIGGLLALAAGVCFMVAGFIGLPGGGASQPSGRPAVAGANRAQLNADPAGEERQQQQVRAEQRYMLAFPALLHLAAGAMVLIMARLPAERTAGARVSLVKPPVPALRKP